ncbi:hypothetical protein K3N28_05420 [Glycomyces sp. TRM65418]|uniref:hypothetical protein n=1 Tax=Glycomyces sp. TRM65418 TaxID=2867006 RepID=UPI001CE58923|nr:hypothetical protein [Glycomyces sp. TRM65418]MCC3762507.1 hypothetical protein [Glycomyces sp. TRM65418]QZD56550.1 hypothetical protein K3N28_05380 [Glycomyces sp. TRM65418]
MSVAWIRPRPVRDRFLPSASHWSSEEISDADIPATEELGELLYARGFLLAPHRHDVPVAHWRQVRIGELWLSYDPRSACAVVRSGHSWVAVLGRVICLETWDDDVRSIATALLRAKASGRDAFLDRIDGLSGRFAVIYNEGAETYLQSDAASLRSVYFGRRDGRTYAASHAHLVADRVGTVPSAFPDPQTIRKECNAYAFPGRVTQFARVFALTPNTELAFGIAEPRRFFPREALAPRVTEDAVDEVLPLLQRQLELLASRTPLVISLTAGLDSRTTLALSRSIKDQVDYFTYDSKTGAGESGAAMRADVAAAREMSEDLGFRHHRIQSRFRIPPEPLAGIMDRNSKRISAPGLYGTHRLYEGGCRGLHIRSNLYEIARSFYRAKRTQPDRLTPEHMAYLLTSRKTTPESFAATFAEFADAVEFDRAQDLYDPLDLYYWEHRCGTWLAAHHIESDVVFDTFTIFNSRRIYKALLALPLEDRISGAAFVEMIRRTWPESLKFPVNGAIIEA